MNGQKLENILIGVVCSHVKTPSTCDYRAANYMGQQSHITWTRRIVRIVILVSLIPVACILLMFVTLAYRHFEFERRCEQSAIDFELTRIQSNIECYKDVYGQFPQSLDDLEVLKNYFNNKLILGKAFRDCSRVRYRRTEENRSYQLYYLGRIDTKVLGPLKPDK